MLQFQESATVESEYMLDIHTFADRATATRMATEAVGETLMAAIDRPVLFLVSGGSCLNLLHALDPMLFDARVTMGVLDERYSSDPSINNYSQFIETDFYGITRNRGVTCIETAVFQSETIDEMAKRWDMELKDWRISHADGKIIVLQGIGPDGHTAGMMPDEIKQFNELFDNPNVWVVGYDAQSRNKYPLRVTVTMPFLRNVDTSIVYAVGEEKKAALSAALAPEGNTFQIPARIIHEMKHCLLYTDQSVDTVKV